MELLTRGVITIPFRLDGEVKRLRDLLARYADVPMSLADACLVRMSELHPEARVVTLDAHFRVYRRLGRRVIPVVMP
jgi:predicted nucleic acid-binding protein